MAELSLANVVVGHSPAQSSRRRDQVAQRQKCERVHSARGGEDGTMMRDKMRSLIQGPLHPVYNFGFCSPSNRKSKGEGNFQKQRSCYLDLAAKIKKGVWGIFWCTEDGTRVGEDDKLRSGLCALLHEQPNQQSRQRLELRTAVLAEESLEDFTLVQMEAMCLLRTEEGSRCAEQWFLLF